MPLEAVIIQQNMFGHSSSPNTTKEDLFNLIHGGNWSFQIEEQEFGALQIHGDHDYYQAGTGSPGHGNGNLIDPSPTEDMFPGETSPGEGTNWPHLDEMFSPNYDQEADLGQDDIGAIVTWTILKEWSDSPSSSVVDLARSKRRRARSGKNKEEIENQRMTHIAVERNRRKQMNEYLSVLRSLMPDSYVTRVDQASIIGGAINFVKELEQRLQLLTAGIKRKPDVGDHYNSSLPFSEFFTFPQYTTEVQGVGPMGGGPMVTELSTVADIEVTMAETHASLKIRSKRKPRQLLKIVSGMQFLRLTVLHLNVLTIAQFVLYCLSVKVEDDCKLTSVDEIATSVHKMLCGIQENSYQN